MISLLSRIRFPASTLITNEYKFYVDFRGMLYFNDTKEFIFPNAIKDKKFIEQLYGNLRRNEKAKSSSEISNVSNLQSYKTEEDSLYPYMAQFWGERNLVRCGISPVVFNRILSRNSIDNQAIQREYNSEQQFLEFSLGLYSLFRVQELKVDNQGRLWYPLIKVPIKKQKSKEENSSTIMGVFSNELISNLLDSISYEGERVHINYKGVVSEIQKMQ